MQRYVIQIKNKYEKNIEFLLLDIIGTIDLIDYRSKRGGFPLSAQPGVL